MPESFRKQLDADFGKPTDWYWGGKVIEVVIAYDSLRYYIEITVDWGYGFMIFGNEEISWPDGPWGPKGYIKVSDFENKRRN